MLDQLVLGGVPARRSHSHTLFFALHPDDAAATAMESLSRKLRRELGIAAQLQQKERLHVTLHLIAQGDIIQPRRLTQACEAGASLRFRPFKVAFDRVARYGSRSFVLLGHDGTPGLTQFHERLCLALAGAGIRPGSGAAFSPHVTLAYTDSKVTERFVEPIAWTVRDFVLIDSLVGQTIHRVMGRWGLES
jgi:2'-5' RNA ligase